MSLMTGSKSSYVIQKLISVLPSSELEELTKVILDNFIALSLDKVGCRVVQFLLEFSSSDQQTLITRCLAEARTLVKLATSPHGTYVAQVRTHSLFYCCKCKLDVLAGMSPASVKTA